MTYFLNTVLKYDSSHEEVETGIELIHNYLNQFPECDHVLTPLEWDKEKRTFDVVYHRWIMKSHSFDRIFSLPFSAFPVFQVPRANFVMHSSKPSPILFHSPKQASPQCWKQTCPADIGQPPEMCVPFPSVKYATETGGVLSQATHCHGDAGTRISKGTATPFQFWLQAVGSFPEQDYIHC